MRDRSREDIEAFLADLAKRSTVKNWQVKQAEQALKILYETFLPNFSPNDTARKETGPEMKAATTIKIHKSGAFRDRVIPGEVDRLFSPLFKKLQTEIRARHYSIRTERAYLDWVRRFIAFHGYADPGAIDTTRRVKQYLDYLAVEREVAASTQNQALNALLFFFTSALQQPIGEMEEFVRAKRPQRLPEVMTRDEVQALFDRMEGITALMAGLMYGGGLRLMECLRLRIKDIDFGRHQIMVRDGKGQKDRVTILPERYVAPLQEHLAGVKIVYEADRAKGAPGVYIWPALARKYPKAATQWIWYYFFPPRAFRLTPGAAWCADIISMKASYKKP